METNDSEYVPPFIALLTNKFLKGNLTDLENICLEEWLNEEKNNRQLFIKKALKIKAKSEDNKSRQLSKP